VATVNTDLQGMAFYQSASVLIGNNGQNYYYSDYFYMKPTANLTADEMNWLCNASPYIPSDQSLVLTHEMRTILNTYWQNYTGLGNQNIIPLKQLCDDTLGYMDVLTSTCLVQPYDIYPTLQVFFNNESFSVKNQTLRDIALKRQENLIERTKTEGNITTKLFSIFQKQPAIPVEWPPSSMDFPDQLYFIFPF